MKLSERLQIIANQINAGETMADIGTDHGFLPIYLFEKEICPKAILCDVSPGSLQKAVENVKESYGGHCPSAFEFRLGDGLSVLSDGEVNTLVIAGMGGILMTEILGADLAKSKTFNSIILQPRNGQGRLRHWLGNNYFAITGELLAREGPVICEVLAVKTSGGKKPDFSYESMELEIPEELVKQNGRLGLEFAKRKIDREEKILERIKSARDPDPYKLAKTEASIKYLKMLLKKYE